MSNTRRIVCSEMRTPDGTVLRSHDTHDYVTHDDANGRMYMLDGGCDYVRSSAWGDEEYMTVFSDAPHAVLRRKAVWGTYGKDGKAAFTRVPVCAMSINHINAVLAECMVHPTLKAIFIAELKYREDFAGK